MHKKNNPNIDISNPNFDLKGRAEAMQLFSPGGQQKNDFQTGKVYWSTKNQIFNFGVQKSDFYYFSQRTLLSWRGRSSPSSALPPPSPSVLAFPNPMRNPPITILPTLSHPTQLMMNKMSRRGSK